MLVIDDGTEPHVTDSKFLGNRPLRPEHRHPGGIALTVSHYKMGESKLLASLRPRKRASRACAIAEELSKPGPYCPLPIQHDKRVINDWDPTRLHREHNVRCHLLMTRALTVQRRQQRPWLLPNSFPQAIWGQHEKATPIPIRGSKDDECDVLLRLWVGDEARVLPGSTLYWVADGVVVKRTPLGVHGNLRLEILADASELPLDLTGLSLADTSLAETSQARVLAAVQRELSQAGPECARQAPHAAERLQTLSASLGNR